MVGIALKNKYTDFDCRNYGFKKLSTFLKHLGFEVDKDKMWIE